MACIYGKEVNKISECNLLHDILNPPKQTKNFKIHYSPIQYGCMNTDKSLGSFVYYLIVYVVPLS